MPGETGIRRLAVRERDDMEARRREFEAAHQVVVRLSHPVTGEIRLNDLAAAWNVVEQAHRAYAEAYRAFFHAADKRR